jgi:hypothetical protein
MESAFVCNEEEAAVVVTDDEIETPALRLRVGRFCVGTGGLAIDVVFGTFLSSGVVRSTMVGGCLEEGGGGGGGRRDGGGGGGGGGGGRFLDSDLRAAGNRVLSFPRLLLAAAVNLLIFLLPPALTPLVEMHVALPVVGLSWAESLCCRSRIARSVAVGFLSLDDMFYFF